MAILGRTVAERYCTAYHEDPAIDWDASDASAEEYQIDGTGLEKLAVRSGEQVTQFWFRLLTHDETIELYSRWGAGGTQNLGHVMAQAKAAFELAVVEVDGFWKPSDGPIADAVDRLPLSVVTAIGSKIIHMSQLSEHEAKN